MEDSTWIWILRFFGRLHPLTVHFPIGLLIVAFFMELFTIGGKRQPLREGIQWMVYLGAAFAILAAILGLLLRTYDDYTGDLVRFHQNMGIAAAVSVALTALLLRITLKGKLSSFIGYRSALGCTVIILGTAGHLGAQLTHGEDFLTDILPGNNRFYDDSKAVALLTDLSPLDSLSEAQQDDLNLEVRAILAQNCYQCHNENKQKGELVLDSKRGVFKGGKSGSVIAPGRTADSELYRRITLSPNHDDVMPKKGKVLKDTEIDLIGLWIEKGAYWSDRALKVFPEAPLALSKPNLPNISGENHPIDKLVDVYFEEHDIDWPAVVDDKTFVRRAYLDIVGLLPEPGKIAQFVRDQNPGKRNVLIDALLDDNTNYTQHWLSFWNDLLRNDYSGTGYIGRGRKQITDWLYRSLEQNKPYNLMVKELVDPTEASEGFIKGIQWRGVVNASQRTEMQAAQNIGQSLMGVNVKCASCHNSFVSNLTLEQSYGFASVFADSVLELNRCDKPIGKMAQVNFLYPELGEVAAETLKERLRLLSEVMVKPENGRLYRTITNRFWKRLLGRGIIEPMDEMDGTPWDSALLDWLAADFIATGHDLKHLIKTIMTSKTYQLQIAVYGEQQMVKSDAYIFQGPLLRRMSAEQFSDAVSQVVAPVYHAVSYTPQKGELSSNRIWHREVKYDRDVLPDPGKRYFRRTFTLANKEIAMAEVLISVDHSYQLHMSGKKVSQGTDWRKVDKLEVGEFLSPGGNTIAIEGTNEGSMAKPAGILFAMKIRYADGEEVLIQSGEKWKSTPGPVDENWTAPDYNDTNWANAKDFGSRHWDALVNFKFAEGGPNFARASLVKQHPFMKALGRPSRENVTTSRDEQATLLQALELTNGVYFNQVLADGADRWLEKYGNDKEDIVTSLYHSSLGRKPTKQEKKVMLAVLGTEPTKEALQDLFWSTLILPEFQFIY